ncbi:hypothetical protein LTR13_002164 [Exophiala sideris]|nr:hypothetical protein LTR13_002164 [Exophiala sideris]
MARYWDLTQHDWGADIDLTSPVRRKIDIVSPPSENVTKTKRCGRTAVSKANPFQKENDNAAKKAGSASPVSEADRRIPNAANGWTGFEETRGRLPNIRTYDSIPVSSQDQVSQHWTLLLNAVIEEDLKLLYPPQCSTTWRPKKVHNREEEVQTELIMMEHHKAASEEKEFLEFDLHDFCDYRAWGHPNGFRGQFESLMTVASEKDKLHWLVDGVIEHKGIQRRVMGAQIINPQQALLVPSRQSDQILLKLLDRLRLVSRLFQAFFIDYLFDNRASDLCLNDFEAKFWTWLQTLHGNHINKWHAQCRFQTDFYKHVTYFAQFLRIQAYSLYEQDPTELSHPIWDEIGVGVVCMRQEPPTITWTVAT